jgi:hypothetical protein
VDVKPTKKMTYNPEDKQSSEDQGKLELFIKSSKMVDILKKKGVKSLFPVQYMTYKIVL